MDDRVQIIHADCLDALKSLAGRGVLFDAVCCDPPYHLTSIVKRFGAEGAAPVKAGATGAFARASAGFMGKTWDGGDVAFRPETWELVRAVMKPGAHLVAFGGTRTYHRMAVAIEDAGFEIRESLMWLYASGFPKSHDVSKAIDKAARGVPHGGTDPTSPNHGRYRTQATEGVRGEGDAGRGYGAGPGQYMREQGVRDTRALVPEAEAWQGWGTALKPAFEPIVVGRVPLDGTVAENVLAHGTGALHIDACRVPAENRPLIASDRRLDHNTYSPGLGGSKNVGTTDLGRWPANVVHDGSDEVEAAFAAYGDRGAAAPVKGTEPSAVTNGIYGQFAGRVPGAFHGDSGSASRFFFSAKADREDRWGSKHPTVKPVELMRWLVRLVTPPGGLILDPFAGSGTTGVAALAEGMRAVLIEREPEYVADIQSRIAHYQGRGAHRLAAKNRKIAQTVAGGSDLPLFGGPTC